MPTQPLMSSDAGTNANEDMGNKDARAGEEPDEIVPGGGTAGPSGPGGQSLGSGDPAPATEGDKEEEEEPTEEEDNTPAVVKEILAGYYNGVAKPDTMNTAVMPMPTGTDDKGEPQDEDCYRIPIVGGLDAEKNTSCEATTGICYHACKSMEGIKGILRDGRVRAMPWVEGDANSGSGTHGFYARAWAEAWTDEEDAKMLRQTFRLATTSHCDTGIIMELRYHAVKNVISKAGDEHTKVMPGHCTRFKSGSGADKIDRWCFHESCARLEAMWITPWAINRHIRHGATTTGGLPKCYASMGARRLNKESAEKKEEEGQYTDPKGTYASPYTKYDQYGKKQRSKHFPGKEGDQETEQDQSWKSHEDKPWKKGDWECPKCKYHNYASRTECNKCGGQRTDKSIWKGGGGGGGSGSGGGGADSGWDSGNKRRKGEGDSCGQANLSKFLDAVRAMQV